LFRKSPRGGQPEELWETDFDVICPQIPHQGHVLIAETLRVMMEIMDSFEEQLGPYYIRLNNYVMLDSLIRDVCGEPEPIQHQVIDVVAKTWRSTWDQTERKLQKISGIKQTTIATLAEILSITMSANIVAALKKIETVYGSKSKTLVEGCKEMSSVLSWTKTFGVFSKIKLDITLVHNYRYFEDFVFQAVLKKGGREGVIAAGGKYSSLIQNYSAGRLGAVPRKDPTNTKFKIQAGIVNHAPIAVGVNFALDRLVAYVTQFNQAHGAKNPDITAQLETETEVLLLSEEKSMLNQRIGLAVRLWERGIKAEYLYDGADHSIEKVTDYCTAQGIPVIFIFKERLYNRDQSLKVKTVFGRLEATMNENDAINFLINRRQNIASGKELPPHTQKAAEIDTCNLTNFNQKQDRKQEKQHNIHVGPDRSAPSTPQPLPRVNSDVEILNKEIPSKQKKKIQTTVEKIIEKNISLLSKLSAIKAYVVDIPIALLREIAQAWDPQTQAMVSLTGQRAKFKPQVNDLKTALLENRNAAPFVIVFSNIDNQFVYIQCTK